MISRLVLTLLSVLVLAAPAAAALQISEAEQVVIAFFKVANRTPDYKYWIHHLPRMQNTEGAENRKKLQEQEMTRLKWGYSRYNTQDDLIKISHPVILSLSEKGGQTVLGFKKAKADDPPFFAYPYGMEAIALVAEGLEGFKTMTLKPEDTPRIKAAFAGKSALPATLKLRLHPRMAVIDSPMVVEDLNFWMLKAEIAYLAFEPEGEGAETLLSYNAPGYLSKNEQQLLDILE